MISKKIAIVCGSPSSEFLAPFDNPEYDIYVLGNRLDRFLDKGLGFTHIFEIHDCLDEHEDPAKYAHWLTVNSTPLIVGEKFPHMDEDHVNVYPYEEVKQFFGADYLTSSSAYMMGYAILQGATHIEIYGVDMAVDDHEYFWQRPCMEAWIGFAKGRGIEVYIPDVSPLCKSKYVEGRDWGIKTDEGVYNENDFLTLANQHQSKMSELDERKFEIELSKAAHDGAAQVYARLAKVARAKQGRQDIGSLSDSVLIK